MLLRVHARDPQPPTRFLPYLLGVVACLPMLFNGFTQDDFTWVANAIRSLHHPWYLVRMPDKEDFRPLVCVTFWANLLVFGIRPFGYLLSNLVIHLVNVGLVMRLAERVTRGGREAAVVAGSLFAVTFGNYGLAVAWICGRTGPLADAFLLAGLLAYWDGLAGGGWRPRALGLACFVFGLLTKETSVVVVPAIALAEWVEAGSLRALARRDVLRRMWPWFAVLAAYLVFHFAWWRRGSAVVGNEYALGPHALASLGSYLARMLLPVDAQSLLVPMSPAARAAAGFALPALAVLVPLGWLALFLRVRSRTVRFAVPWMVLTLAPYLWFTFRTSTRYLYTPSIGLCLLAAAGWSAWRRRAASAATARARWAPTFAVAALVLVSALALDAVILRLRHVGAGSEPWRASELARLAADPDR